MDLLSLVKANTEIRTLRGKTVGDTDRTSVSIKDMASKALVVAKVVVGHAGKYYNGGVFTPKGIRDGLKSWPKAPVLNGGHYADSIGTVLKAEYRDLSGGKESEYEEKHSYNLDASAGLGEEVLWIAIHDAKAAEKVIDGRFNRMSVGRFPDQDNAKASVCSICGSPSVGRYCCNGENGDDNEDNIKLHHYYGDRYKTRDKEGKVIGEKKAYSIMSSFSNVHLAFIEDGYAGDPMTRVEEVTVVGDDKKDLVEDASIEVFAVWKDGSRIVDMANPDKNILDSCVDRQMLLDSLNSGPELTERGPTIYPTGVENEKLTDTQFSLVKGILGNKRLSGRERDDLPDNAYVGPNRTFPAHNPTYVQAGLSLLRDSSLAIDPAVRSQIHFELRRRENLHTTDRVFSSKLTDQQFNRALVIHSLDKARCLANEDVRKDPDYQQLLTELKDDTISFDRFRQLMGSDGVGPNGCLPAATEIQKSASVKAVLDGLYKGPVKAETLLSNLGADPALLKQETGVQKDKLQATKATPMEPNLSQVLDFLSKASAGDLLRVSEVSGISSLSDKKVKDAVDKTISEKDAEIKTLKDELVATQAVVKTRLVDEIIELRIEAGKLAETVKDRNSDAYKNAKGDLDKKSLDALTAIRDAILEFRTTAAPTKDKANESPKPSNPPEEKLKDKADAGESNPKKDSVKSALGW